nr:MAG TPA: hypothetical protein [Caudoviricetes sp.]
MPLRGISTPVYALQFRCVSTLCYAVAVLRSAEQFHAMPLLRPLRPWYTGSERRWSHA